MWGNGRDDSSRDTRVVVRLGDLWLHDGAGVRVGLGSLSSLEVDGWMMSIMWQYIAVLVLLVVAVAYLGIRYYRREKGKPSCSNCALHDAVRRQAGGAERPRRDQRVSGD